jgi:hypothetical protein
MKNSVKKEVEELIEECNLNCSIEEFKDEVNWGWISYYTNLSENFIREFKNKIDWNEISRSQKLSELFIFEFQDKLDINYLIKNNKITKKRLLEIKELECVNNKYELLQL